MSSSLNTVKIQLLAILKKLSAQLMYLIEQGDKKSNFEYAVNYNWATCDSLLQNMKD